MTNPLIEKFYELHPEKKEKPKQQEIKTTLTKDELEALAPYVTNATVSSRPIVSYDPHSVEHFFEVAEKVKTKDAKVTSVTISRDSVGSFSTGLQTITFEVRVYDTP